MTRKRPAPRATPEEVEMFRRFWEAYPGGRKGRRDRAQRAFVEIARAAEDRTEWFEKLMAGVERYARYCRHEIFTRGDLAFRYILHAQTFLEKERWTEDWPAPFDPATVIDPNTEDMEWWLKHLGCR